MSEIYARQVKTIWRVCFSYMQNSVDTDDMVQETFVRLMTYSPKFENEKQERAWLIKTASNLCKDILKSKERNCESLDDHLELAAEEPASESLASLIMKLNDRWRIIVYLYHYEGYHIKEISKLMNLSETTVATALYRARKKLKKMLEEENEE